jgi:hypothetical protein
LALDLADLLSELVDLGRDGVRFLRLRQLAAQGRVLGPQLRLSARALQHRDADHRQTGQAADSNPQDPRFGRERRWKS